MNNQNKKELNITRHNYELFFIDYADAKLTAEEQRALVAFLEHHLDLKEEFQLFIHLELSAEPEFIRFPKKEQLKKEIPEWNREEFDWYCTAKVENDLTPGEEELLETYLKQHPHLQPEVKRFEQTKLVVDTTIQFQNKSSLKKNSSGLRIISYYTIAAAASILLLIGLFITKNNVPDSVVTLTHVTPVISQPVPLLKPQPITTTEPVSSLKTSETITFLPEKKTATTPYSSPNDSIVPRLSPITHRNDSAAVPVSTPVSAVVTNTMNDTSISNTIIPSDEIHPVMAVTTHEDEPEIEEEEEEEENDNQPANGFWKIVQKGVTKLQKITEKEVALKTKKNETGTVYAFSAGKFQLSGKTKR